VQCGLKNPNPQAMQISAYEGIVVTVTMRPALKVPWTGADTFQLNVRDQFGNVVLRSTMFVVTDFINGVVQLQLTSAQTGDLDTGITSVGDSVSNPAGGDFPYDFWRTTPGSEKRLAWGTLSALPQQWKP